MLINYITKLEWHEMISAQKCLWNITPYKDFNVEAHTAENWHCHLALLYCKLYENEVQDGDATFYTLYHPRHMTFPVLHFAQLY